MRHIILPYFIRETITIRLPFSYFYILKLMNPQQPNRGQPCSDTSLHGVIMGVVEGDPFHKIGQTWRLFVYFHSFQKTF